MNLRIAEMNRMRPYLLAVLATAASIICTAAYAASDNLNTTLTKGTTTHATPTSGTHKRSLPHKGISKKPAVPVVMPLSQDARGSWDKKWGPLVPHKTFPKKCD